MDILIVRLTDEGGVEIENLIDFRTLPVHQRRRTFHAIKVWAMAGEELEQEAQEQHGSEDNQVQG